VSVLVEGPSKKAAKLAGEGDVLPGWHGGADAEVRGQRSEASGQRSEDRGQRSEDRSEDGGSRIEDGGDVPGSNGDRSPLTTHHSLVPIRQLMGRTTCDRIVVFDGNPRLAGTIAEVLIEDCTPTTLLGAIATLVVQHGSSELLPILH
jgi:tRNA-2-methylthio-N6-dimethylallyladenosine synthase